MRFHPNIPADLIAHVEELFEEDFQYDCGDNLRIACETTGDGMDDYIERELSGCCGSIDKQIIWNDGLTYIYGWNYGH